MLYKGSIIAESALSKNNKILQKEKKIEKLLNNREYISISTKSKPQRAHKPDKDHPWYAFKLRNSAHKKKAEINILK